MIKNYQIIEADTEEYYNLKIAVDFFEKYTDMPYSIKETWKDMGAGIKWTTIIQDGKLMQCLMPHQWLSIINANTVEEIENTVIEIINEYPSLYGLNRRI